MIKTMPDAANLNWAIGLTALFAVLLISLLRSHTRAFRLKILLMAADLCGIVYFLFGKYAALGVVASGAILSFASSRRRKGDRTLCCCPTRTSAAR